MNTIDMQPAIFEYLCRYGKMGIPRLGSIIWKEYGPRRSSDTILRPPHIKFTFQQNDVHYKEFTKFLAAKCNIPLSRANVLFEKWAKEQWTKLQEGQNIDLKNIGSFSKVGTAIQFNSVSPQDNFELANHHLEFADHGEFQPQPVVLQTEEDDSISWLEIILPIILLGLIGILVYFLWASFDKKSQPKIATNDTIEQVQDDPSVNGNSEKTTRIIPPISDDSTQAEGSATSNDDANETNPEKADSQDSNDNSTSQEQSESEEETVLQGQENRIVQAANAGECIVIVGSFKQEALAQKAVSLVGDKGLRAYTESYGEYTRVGVIFDCETEDLYRKLFQLRGEFGKDAWILKYK